MDLDKLIDEPLMKRDNNKEIDKKNKINLRSKRRDSEGSIKCPCGGSYVKSGRSHHEKTKIHKKYTDRLKL